jgi:hypothetical protein
MVMKESRRAMLKLLTSAAGAIVAAPRVFGQQSQVPIIPGMGQDASQPGTLGSTGEPPGLDPHKLTKMMLDENQKEMKKNVEKLFQLASELKQQVEKTDSTKVLSVSLVKKAQEIAKLAKQIEDRAKG